MHWRDFNRCYWKAFFRWQVLQEQTMCKIWCRTALWISPLLNVSLLYFGLLFKNVNLSLNISFSQFWFLFATINAHFLIKNIRSKFSHTQWVLFKFALNNIHVIIMPLCDCVGKHCFDLIVPIFIYVVHYKYFAIMLAYRQLQHSSLFTS